MQLKKNIKVGRSSSSIFLAILVLFFIYSFDVSSENDLEGKFTDIKVLDKISSKNTLIKLKNGDETRHKETAKDLGSKSLGDQTKDLMSYSSKIMKKISYYL